MNPLISCIVPTHNGERYVHEAIDSILAQTYQGPTEVIVIDDGSTDGTKARVERYGSRVRYHYEPDVGPPAARNAGLVEARGQMVAFLDGDDLWHPEKLERQMARFAARPELDYCLTHVKLFWIPELKEEEEKYKDSERVQPPGYATTTLLAKSSIFDRVGGFDAKLWFPDAADWFTRATQVGAVSEVLPDVLTYRRMHHTNITRRKTAQARREWLEFLKSSLDRRRESESGTGAGTQ
ncbi:MAG TPA: glycosyltransferase family A protein [Gemmatimonadaceae bacterium]|nr:glycosyltransferase family A protein [Gemmatimonadaceae bacterium]